ncbi:MAG: glycosyltransferase [Alistipes sp.]|nr:glycosyltransferase [Alistipes sp.]
MKEPLVSVCMTAYNHAPYIARAIEGVLKQRTTFGVELIIGEDCSHDNTLAICREYAKRYPERIRIMTAERNVGMRENYRRTALAAQGRYVAYCDGDDFWIDEEKLQRQVEALENNPSVGMCYTRSERRIEHSDKRWIYPKEGLFVEFEKLLFNNTVENCTAVARRELIERYYAEVQPECHPEWLTDDAPMWIWFAAESRIVALEQVTAVHSLLKESVSQSSDYLKRIAFCDSLVDISLWFDERYSGGKFSRKLLRKRMEVALWVLSYNGSFKEYFSRWWQDVRHTPRLLFNLAGYGLAVKKVWRNSKFKIQN